MGLWLRAEIDRPLIGLLFVDDVEGSTHPRRTMDG